MNAKILMLAVLLPLSVYADGYDSGTNYYEYGNSVYGSDGSSATRVGKQTFYQDGSSSYDSGHSIINSDGTYSTRGGNTIVTPSGKYCYTVGKQTICQ